MPQPFVVAHHLLWTAYGWWLPNDPRGSGSKIIRNPSLTKLGDLHYGRKSDQPSGHEIRTFYSRAQPLLRHNLLTLHGDEVPTAACGLAQCIQQHNFTCYACAIMPDHVHLVLRKHKHAAEEMIDNLQALSHERLIPAGYRAAEHPVWTLGGWRRFLDRPRSVRNAITYVEQNPLEIGLPKQRWPFVTKYDDWPLHPGHSPNSPYAKKVAIARRGSVLSRKRRAPLAA